MSDIPNDEAFFDTNMRRVLHRLFFGPDVPKPTAPDREITGVAEALVPPGGGWHWNQALMEFGALRCTARRPDCEGCLLREDCRSHPEVTEALANAPRRARRSADLRYEDSNRYLRGRVLAQLRNDPAGGEGIALRDLGGRLRERFTEDDVPRLYEVVESLKKDGLVAEEQAPYGTNSEEPREPRVRLP